MLRLNQHTSLAAAKTYYQPMVGSVLSGYYLSEQKDTPDKDSPTIGRVDGKLADRLNLAAGMSEEQFHEFLEGNATDPNTGEKLRKRQNRDGKNRIGLDLTFDPGGKSLSVYYAGTQDPLIPQLFDEARHESMVNDVEPRMMARVRKNGANHSRVTGSALWTSFPDLVTRPTKVQDKDGKWKETLTVDPHIHDHNFLFQYTWDSEYKNKDGSKGAYLAADTSKIFASMPYIQKAFHARLYRKLQEHGYNVEKTEHGLELKGWNDQMSKLYSRRKEQIEAWALERGIDNASLKDLGGKITRGSKTLGKLTPEDQFAEWRSRLSEEEWQGFIESATRADASNSNRKITYDQAIDYGLAHTLERDNSATLEEVMTAALDVGMGLDVDKLRERLLHRKDVVSANFGNDVLLTTQGMVELEHKVLERASKSQASCLPLGSKDFTFRPIDSGNGQLLELNNDQKTNVRKLLASTSRIMTLRGAPGVGKTAVLGTQLFRAVEENGGEVISLGSTSNARDQLIKFGQESGSTAMQNAVTLARFLNDQEAQDALTSSSLIVLDEATLVGLKDLEELTKVVESKHARLLLVGDYRQMDAVQAHAKIFEQLTRIGGHGEFKEIVRQRDPDYRRAAMLTSSGDDREAQAGFDKLVELGFVQQIDNRKDRIEQAAKVYLDITSEKKSRRGKETKWSDEEKRDAVNYRSGMTVIRGKGKKAAKLEVVGRDAGRVLVVDPSSEEAKPFALDLNKPKELKVYEPNYNDALLIVGTHKEGEAITGKIRDVKRQNGELGREAQFDRMESLGLSEAERKLADSYQPGTQFVEFSRKAKARPYGSKSVTRSIGYGERFSVSRVDSNGGVTIRDSKGKELELPLELAGRFDVYREKKAKVAVGDRIRMTKGGNMLADETGKSGVRFSNNDVFTVKGFDTNGNPVLNNGHRLDKDWKHWRSGYYKTSMAGQGSTSSHNIFVDSMAAGRARSRESWLVSITRGKHAATILTDDIQGLRSKVITRSSQRPSATEVFNQKRKMSAYDGQIEMQRLENQTGRLKRIESSARLAFESTWELIMRKSQEVFDKTRHLLPLATRRMEEPAT